MSDNLFRLKEGWGFRGIGKGSNVHLYKKSYPVLLCGRRASPGLPIGSATKDIICKQCLANYLRITGDS